MNHQKIWKNDYAFEQTLDSLVMNPYFELSMQFVDTGQTYSHRFFHYGRILKDEFDFLVLKRTPFNPLNIDDCEIHLLEFQNFINYIKEETGKDYSLKYLNHEVIVKKYVERLKRKNSIS